jgi:hypothetical protein
VSLPSLAVRQVPRLHSMGWALTANPKNHLSSCPVSNCMVRACFTFYSPFGWTFCVLPCVFLATSVFGPSPLSGFFLLRLIKLGRSDFMDFFYHQPPAAVAVMAPPSPSCIITRAGARAPVSISGSQSMA